MNLLKARIAMRYQRNVRTLTGRKGKLVSFNGRRTFSLQTGQKTINVNHLVLVSAR